MFFFVTNGTPSTSWLQLKSLFHFEQVATGRIVLAFWLLTGQWVLCFAGWRPASFFRMAYVTAGQGETVVKHPLQNNAPAWAECVSAKDTEVQM